MQGNFDTQKLSQKRFKSESTMNFQITGNNYITKNFEYIENGMNQYTMQFLKRLTNANQCIYSVKYSS